MGFDFITQYDHSDVVLQSCSLSTPVAQIPQTLKWRSILRNVYLITIDAKPINSMQAVKHIVSHVKIPPNLSLTFTGVLPERINVTPDSNIPKIHSGQMNDMVHKHHLDEHHTSS